MTSVVLSAPLIDAASLFKVLIASLLGGAGLVTIFALGLTGVSAYLGGTDGGSVGGGAVTAGRKSVGLAVAAICFAVVVAGVAFGIWVLLRSS